MFDINQVEPALLEEECWDGSSPPPGWWDYDGPAGLPADPAVPVPDRVRVARAAASGHLGVAAALVDGVDPAGLDEADRLLLLDTVGRLEAQVAGLRMRVVAAHAGPEPAAEDRWADFTDVDVASALHLAVPSAERLVHAARQLSALPRVAAALNTGALSYLSALAVIEGSYELSPDAARRFETLVMDKAPGRSPGQVRALVRRSLARVDPDRLATTTTTRAQAAVIVEQHDNGLADLHAHGIPAVDAAVLDRALDAGARTAKAAGDPRPLGQLRVATLIRWADQHLHPTDPAGPAPTQHGRPICVQVTLDLPTLLGLTDHPADVDGTTMISAADARALLGDATLRRLITDPDTGYLLHHGQRTYRPPAALAAAVNARYLTTTGPGSTSLASTGDLDHDQPWQPHADGGSTDPHNLHPVSRRWHQAKTHGHWTTTIHPDGTVEWTSPHGKKHHSHPHDYRTGP